MECVIKRSKVFLLFTRWRCDTTLAWLRSWCLATSVEVVRAKELKCVTPASLRHRSIIDLDVSDFVAQSNSFEDDDDWLGGANDPDRLDPHETDADVPSEEEEHAGQLDHGYYDIDDDGNDDGSRGSMTSSNKSSLTHPFEQTSTYLTWAEVIALSLPPPGLHPPARDVILEAPSIGEKASTTSTPPISTSVIALSSGIVVVAIATAVVCVIVVVVIVFGVVRLTNRKRKFRRRKSRDRTVATSERNGVAGYVPSVGDGSNYFLPALSNCDSVAGGTWLADGTCGMVGGCVKEHAKTGILSAAATAFLPDAAVDILSCSTRYPPGTLPAVPPMSPTPGGRDASTMTLVPGRDINHEGPMRVYKWTDF